MAIAAALADLVPEKNLISKPGTWSRNLHYQWATFAINEMDPYLHSSEINTVDFILPKNQHVPAIIEQNTMMPKRAVAVPEAALRETDYLVDGCFSATDIIVGYTISWCQEQRLLDGCSNLIAYLERLLARPHCTLTRH
jgi:glutathione S-transferase